MPYSSLREFIDRLEASGRLVRVTAPVSPDLEMTEIQTRLLAEGGPAALFENVVDADSGRIYPMPVLVNLFGTVERVAWGMDREPHQLREVGETLAFLKQPEPPGGWREALELLPLLRPSWRCGRAPSAPRRARRSCCAGPRSTLPRCRSRPAGRASRRR